MENIKMEILSALNILMGICEDKMRGYRLAAEKENDDELKSIFSGYSDEREGFISELRQEVSQLGGDSENLNASSNGVAGSIVPRIANAGENSDVILNEFAKDESVAVCIYEKILRISRFPENLKNRITNQCLKIKQACEKMNDLRFREESYEDIGSATDGAPD